MAFVINKTEYKSLFQLSSSIPGPGAYDPKFHYVEQSSAPFNASATKQTCFQFKESNLGPGSYDRTSIGECFRSKSTVATTFKSKAARFPYQQKRKSRVATEPDERPKQNSLLQQKNNRPVSTKSNFRQKKLEQKKKYLLELRKRNQERKIASIVNKQNGKVRILLSNPHNTENVESFYIEDYVNIKTNGTGDYEIRTSAGEKHKSVLDWAKDRQKRFGRSKSMATTHLGPGSYDLIKKQEKSSEKKLTSSFSYSGVRTFMDTIIYKTRSHTKASILESKGLNKVADPGPADYSPQKKARDSFYYGKEIMGSTVERFELNRDRINIPGPGYYVNTECKQKYEGMVKEIRNKIFSKHGSLAKENHPEDFVSLEVELSKLKPLDQEITHELVPCTLKQRCESKAGTLSQAPRFKETKKVKQPGPGQYYSLFDIKSPPEPSSIFKSSTERQPYEVKKNNAVDTFYEVNKQDIAIRSKKIKQNITSLKKVSIEKPAFDSSVVRFASSAKEASTQSDKKMNPTTVASIYERDQIDYELFKPYKQKTSYASVFRSTTTRDPFVVKDIPGPGSYKQKDMLNKVSHNIQYQTTKKQKAQSTSKIQAV